MPDRPRSEYPFRRIVPEGDNRLREVCADCGWIHYDNPRIVVGSVCTWEERILLCKRSIDPRSGHWTIPAGFLEERESPEQGAAREALEEARARIEIDALLGIYTVPRINQVQLLYRARLLSPEVEAADETEAVRLVRYDEIPWEELAFPSVDWVLRRHRERQGTTGFPPACHTAD